MGTCYIVGAADAAGTQIELSAIKNDDCVIAADGGYLTLQKWRIKPDQIIGDFDSLESVPTGENVARYPSEKDDTDMMIAVKLGLEKGYRQFMIYGGLGGRLDHTVANLHVLDYLIQHDARGCLVGKDERVFLIKDEQFSFDADVKGVISIFAYGGEARGVYLKGLKYPLQDATLTTDFPIGVSNEFVGQKSDISVRNGRLLIILPKIQ